MAAQSGVFNFRGKSGQRYSLSAYFDDTANAPVRFSAAGKAGATSAQDWTPPETVALVDVILAAATGQTHTQILRNGQPTGDILLNANNLAAVTFRPPLAIVFSPLTKVSALQLA